MAKRDTGPAKLPALAAVSTGNVALDRWVQAVTERLEVREGARGNPYERAVTVRELSDMGIGRPGVDGVNGFNAGSGAGVLVRGPDGSYSTMTVNDFADGIRGTKLYMELLRRLDDVARFDGVPEQVRAILLRDIAAEAAQRGADIQRLDNKLQTQTQSLAYTVSEVTAAVQGAAAGVRETAFASAEANRATAGKITQVQARLDDVGGVTIEESLTATADRVAGLAGEYMVKVTAGGAIAGFGLAASEDPDGLTESTFIVQADKFAVVSPGLAAQVPFGVDGSGVYVNGSLRVNSGGVTLDSLAAASGIYLSFDTQFFKYGATGALANSTITLTANLTSPLSGYVDWEAIGGYSGTLPTDGTINTATINASDMTADAAAFRISFTSGGLTYTDTVTVAKLRDGTDAITGMLSNEAVAVPANTAGTVTSFAAANTTFKVFQGATDVTDKWAFSKSDSNVTSTLTGSGTATVTSSVTAMSADTGKVSITATRAGYDNLVRAFTITKVKTGATGAAGAPGANGSPGATGGTGATGTRGTITTKISGSWNASTAASAVTAIASAAGATPTTPIKGDIVYYTGGAQECTAAGSPGTWTPVAAYIDGSMVVTGTIATSKLVAGSITGFNIQTAASGIRWSLDGISNAALFRGLNSLGNPTVTMDAGYGSINCSGTGSSSFSSSAGAYTLDVYNSSTGVGIRATGYSKEGINASSISGHGAVLQGNATSAPLMIKSTSKPTNSDTGSIMIYNVPGVGDRLCYCLGGAWYYLAANVAMP